MDKQLNDMIEKIKVTAHAAGNVAAKAATVSAQKAGELYEITKNNIKIVSVEKEIDDICAKIGMLVYEAHKNPEADASPIEALLAEIDGKMALIADLKEKDSELRSEKTCPGCQTRNSRSSAYCSGCGSKL